MLEASVAVAKGTALKGALSDALAKAPGLGGQERRFAAFAVRELSRHQRLLDFAGRLLGRAPSDWHLREDLALARYVLWRRLFTADGAARGVTETKLPGPLRPRTVSDAALAALAADALPPDPGLQGLEAAATRYSFPTWLAEALREVTMEVPLLMAALDDESGLFLRARPPGSAEARIAELAEAGVRAGEVSGVADALAVLDRGTKVFDSRPMKKGLLQVQDVGSQLIVALCRPDNGFEGARIADVCAGAGGKTLALADRVGASGVVEAGDVSQARLAEARRRVKQLRLENVRFTKELALGQADAVLVDAPCSGTGQLAREPQQKWKLTRDAVKDFARRQGELLAQVVAKVRPGTVVVYATCSLLPEENERIVAQAKDVDIEDAPAEVPAAARSGPFLRTLPGVFPGGGFFGARLRKRAAP